MTRASSFSLAEMMAAPPFNHDELAKLRQQAYIEQGLLIVHPWDVRLTPVEAKLIASIGERLYGGEQ